MFSPAKNPFLGVAVMPRVDEKGRFPLSASPVKTRRRSGQPLRQFSQLNINKKKIVLEKLRRHHSIVQRKITAKYDRLSAIEKLPIELIQQIFFYALEINLPRASTHLRQVLSTDATYNALISFAYFDDTGRHPVETKHFLPAEYRVLDCLEKVGLQQSILSCKWCTWDRISSCISVLSRLVMVQAWHEENNQERQLCTEAVNDNPTISNKEICSIAELPHITDKASLERHFLARIEHVPGSSLPQPHGDQPYLPRILTWSITLDEQSMQHKGLDRSMTVVAARYIPSWALRSAAWMDHDLSLLQLLRQGHAFIENDHVLQISASALFEGVANAIQARSVGALKTLLEMHNALFKAAPYREGSSTVAPLTPASNHPIPVELFHMATSQGEESTELLKLLLRAGIDSLPRDDAIVTAWAVHESQKSNRLATWLLEHMEGLANYGLPSYSHLFVDGCLSWRVWARESFPFPETSFASELGYIAGASTKVPSGPNGAICGTYD